MAKKNTNLHSAKKAKNDEFYTQFTDIENEMKHYKDFFKGKVVLCNCDDPLESNFTKYFILNFHHLGLKKLISTFYDINGSSAYVFEYDGSDMNGDGMVDMKDIRFLAQSGACRTILADDKGFAFIDKENCWAKGIYGSGDFRSKNVIDYLKECDIVVTNPPFSLFREYVDQLMMYGKKFIIIGNTNAITYKEIFPYIKNNELWLGCSSFNTGMYFKVPDDYEYADTYKFDREINGNKVMRVSSICWFTNVPHTRRNTERDLYKEYSVEKYPKYDNYDAIEVNNVNNIPCDYNGVMGVPITFLDKYCPTQFEIVGLMSGAKGENLTNGNDGRAKFYVNGKGVYARLLIKLKK